MIKNSAYFRGVAVGLIIAWVTSAIAYYVHGNSSLPALIIFQLIVSVIMIVVSFLMKDKKGTGDVS